jgi:hypothetical protein
MIDHGILPLLTGKTYMKLRQFLIPGLIAVITAALALTAPSEAFADHLPASTPHITTSSENSHHARYRVVTGNIGSSGSAGTSTKKSTATPQAGGGGCTYDSAIPIAAYYNYTSPYALNEVIAQVSDAPTCTFIALIISEEDTVVTPHSGTHTMYNGSCSDCEQLTVYGSYGCTSGTTCAGEWTVTETVRFVLPGGDSFEGVTGNCQVSGATDNILACTNTKSTTVAAHNS